MNKRVAYISAGQSPLLDLALAGFSPIRVSISSKTRFDALATSGPRDVAKFGISIAKILSELRKIRPAVIVLFEREDTRNILPILFRELPESRFISIQSAWYFESAHLHLWWPGDRRRLKILLWGDYQIDLATRQGKDSRGRYAVGSLEAALFSDFFGIDNQSIRESQICLVVKRKFGRADSAPTQQTTERKRITETTLDFVSRFCSDMNLEAVIPADARRSPDELETDRKWLEGLGVSKTVKFSAERPALSIRRPGWFPLDHPLPKADNFSALATAATSRLVVGSQNSAVIWQSLSLRFPVLSIGFGKHKFFEFPIPGPWALHNPTYETFASQAHRISELPSHRFSSSEIAETRYLVNQEPENGTISTLRNLVASAQAGETWDY